MPEMADRLVGLENILNDIQRCALNKKNCEDIVKAVDSDPNIKPEVIEKLLELCIQDPKDVTHAVLMTTIVSTIAKKVDAGEFIVKPDLKASMLKLFHMTKTTIYSTRSEIIMTLYFEALLAYPDEVYLKLEEKCFNEIKELIYLYTHQKIPIEVRVQPIHMLVKNLKVLPPDKRSKVVKEGINIWFLKLIPNIMVFATTPNIKVETYLEALEIVVDNLLCVDYADNPNWQIVLQSIYTPQKYPAIMKNLLEKGSDIWHRLWMVFIKMLKNQITKNSNSVGSPINSMLPVVETAFKMDVVNRCRAFRCWSVLIDNFATETNEVYINKRIKLLLIPLCSNNAKVEETAISKLKTWWHLISCFHKKVNNFSEVILKPFLQFCFGKPVHNLKPVFIPGLLSDKTKECSIEAFAEILGHHNCEGCVFLPKLNAKLLNTKTFVANWKDLIYCMNAAIKVTADNPHKLRKPLRCAWVSFLKDIDELPDSIVASSLFNELLVMLENLIRDCRAENLTDIVLFDILMSFFDGNEKMIQLLKLKDNEATDIQKIISILLNPSFETLYHRYDMSDLVVKLKPFANFIVDKCFNTPASINTLLEKMPGTYNSLVLWTALTATVHAKMNNGEILRKMLPWPLKHMDLFIKVEFSALLWHDMYEIMLKTNNSLHVNNDILKLLMDCVDINPTNATFLLKNSMVLIKHRSFLGNEVGYENAIDLMLSTISKIQSLDYSHPLFLSIMDILFENFGKLAHHINLKIGKKVLSITNIMFIKILSEFKKSASVDAELLLKVKQILICIENMLKLEAYASLKQSISTELIEGAPYFAKQQTLKVTVLAILEILLADVKDNNHPSFSSIKDIIDSIKHDVQVKNPIEQSKFTTPNRVTSKQIKQKETSIINTVVENGEEFVVVKSNWKFNPKKLTDKQKEKLQRQRQDIPALYQDLSQSQDEFKLTTWKTDSQDTTNSSKSNGLHTAANEEVSVIINNMANKDIVPKIIKNILTENTDKRNLSPERTDENIVKTMSPMVKEGKTPRAALQDRVFRNVRNLIEKSIVLHGDDEDNEAKLLFNDIMKTPTGMSVVTSSTAPNSAPSDINIDRPTRIRRKPKKFEDLQLFTMKKRRHSSGNAESQNIDSSDDNSEKQDVTKKSEENEQIVILSDTISENKVSRQSDSTDIEVSHDVMNKNVSKNNNSLNMDKNADTNCKSFIEESDCLKIESDIHNSMPNIESVHVNSVTNLENINKINEKSDVKSEGSIQRPIIRKPRKKKSLIEKELAIDMVEGHPFLKISEKRLTRKNAIEYPNVTRRKSLSQKLQKSKIDETNTPKANKKSKEKDKVIVDLTNETQDLSESKDGIESQDVIESSQDSTVSIMSTKSTKNYQRIPFVKLQHIEHQAAPNQSNQITKSISPENKSAADSVLSNCENKDDSEFSRNKTMPEYISINLTENMDTETIDNFISEEVIEIDDEKESEMTKDKEVNTVEMDTQDIAEADTQPVEHDTTINQIVITDKATEETQSKVISEDKQINKSNICDTPSPTQTDITRTFSESLVCETEKADGTLSILPLKDEDKRKQDFLNNTLELSPIKTLSPVRNNKSPSPETSLDYMVVKLSSPVQSNGEPFEKVDSPEIFTEDKLSPDKRDQSPLREEVQVTNLSPRSLSIKKNKPQVRTGGRAAQMLGLCVPVPDRLHTIMNSEKVVDSEETKRFSPLNTSARRNLRILYNSTNESSETSEENEDSDTFLKLKRSLPAADSSPSVPILKRKHADIIDDTTLSPASKRKRVSFHDPPVSTTICVKKYIEPCGIRSPQNSVAKRQEKQVRSQLSGNLKSQKRLDTAFKLEKALTKAIESFGVEDVASDTNTNDDTDISSLEPTPLAEIVQDCKRDENDPMCMDLGDCKDPSDNVSKELSSSTMKTLFVNEFAKKTENVGDLAGITELEVNRLCIKPPKVQTSKRSLIDYLKIATNTANEMPSAFEDVLPETHDVELKAVDVEVQTERLANESVNIQTEPLATSIVSTQTDVVHTVHSVTQTDQSGSKSTADIVTTLLEKADFCECLKEQLDVPSKRSIADNLPLNALMDILVQNIDQQQSAIVIDRLLEQHTSNSNGRNNNPRLSFMRDYLSDRFSSKDLILFCSELLKKVLDKNI